MEKKEVILVDEQRKQLARIKAGEEGLILEIFDKQAEGEIKTIIEKMARTGVIRHFGEKVERGGRTVFVERSEIVTWGSERFLPALADAINRDRIRTGGRRIFALLEESK